MSNMNSEVSCDYEQKYAINCEKWKESPIIPRQCRDRACIAIFFLVFMAFVGIAFYQSHRLSAVEQSVSVSKIAHLDGDEYEIPMVISMGLSIICSTLFGVLVLLIPKVTVYTIIGLTLMTVSGLCVISFYRRMMITGSLLVITLLGFISIFLLICKSLEKAIGLIRQCTHFFAERKIVFLTPVLKLFGAYLFLNFWSVIFIIISLRTRYPDDFTHGHQIAWTAAWFTFYIFFLLIFYFATTYTVANICVKWSYNMPDSGYLSSYSNIFGSHFGSIVATTLSIPLVDLLKIILETFKSISEENKCYVCCESCLNKIVSQAKELLSVLNHYSIIMISITGESFLESAKTVIGLVWHEREVIQSLTIVTKLLTLWGSVTSACIGTLVSQFFYARSANNLLTPQELTILCFFSGIFCSLLILGVLSESICAVHITERVDAKFQELKTSAISKPSYVLACEVSERNVVGGGTSVISKSEDNTDMIKENITE